MPAGTWGRWAVRHGAARALTGFGAKRGELQARILRDPRTRADPYPLYDTIRARGPLLAGRVSIASASHDVVETVLRTDAFRVGVSQRAEGRVGSTIMNWVRDEALIGPLEPPSMLACDPPDHHRYRRLVSKVFTPRAIEAQRARVEELADELLDKLEGEGTVDIVGRYASLLPVTIIASMLGVPTDMREQFLAWGAAASPTLDVGISYKEFRRADEALRAANIWLHGHFERLRRDPGDDILSKLVSLVDEGESLNELELTATVQLLLAAGFETTVNLLGNGTVLLVRNRDQLALLLQDPSLWPNAVEEILRYESPVQITARIAAKDTTLRDVPVKEGQFVLVVLGGANRDPAVFEEPAVFDVRRANAREHLAFSGGIHYCLGAPLARMEGEVGLRKLFERYPDLTLTGEPHRRPTRTLRGYDRVPVRLGARRSTPVGS